MVKAECYTSSEYTFVRAYLHAYTGCTGLSLISNPNCTRTEHLCTCQALVTMLDLDPYWRPSLQALDFGAGDKGPGPGPEPVVEPTETAASAEEVCQVRSPG